LFERLEELSKKHGNAYDWKQDYYVNYDFGPFCKLTNDEFIEALEIRDKLDAQLTPKSFLGFEVNSTIGVPAGPLLNGRWVLHYAELGFDMPIYKTVRTKYLKCHSFPQVVLVNVPKQLSEKDFEQTFVGKLEGNTQPENVSITNSFGMPSKEPSVWMRDVQRVESKLGEKQLNMVSVYGTPSTEEAGVEELAMDFAKGANLAYQAGAKIVELNFSCPNIKGKGGSLYANAQAAGEICRIVRQEVGNKKFLIKLGYFHDNAVLEESINAITVHADGVSAINTISVKVVDEAGKEALPGRITSGICGNAIREGALRVVKAIAEIRKKSGKEFALVGVGGITLPEHALQFYEAGADAVQSATGAMFDPLLALKIKRLLVEKSKKQS